MTREFWAVFEEIILGPWKFVAGGFWRAESEEVRAERNAVLQKGNADPFGMTKKTMRA